MFFRLLEGLDSGDLVLLPIHIRGTASVTSFPKEFDMIFSEDLIGSGGGDCISSVIMQMIP